MSRPRFAKSGTTAIPTAGSTVPNSGSKLPTTANSNSRIGISSLKSPQHSSNNNQTAEVLTPSSVESLETRLLAKSLVSPSPKIATKKPQVQQTQPQINYSNHHTTSLIKPASQTMATLLPRVAPLAKVDSLDTNLSVSGFQNIIMNRPQTTSIAIDDDEERRRVIEEVEDIEEHHLNNQISANEPCRMDFARFLQNLSENETSATASMMRQSYSLDLRQIPAVAINSPPGPHCSNVGAIKKAKVVDSDADEEEENEKDRDETACTRCGRCSARATCDKATVVLVGGSENSIEDRTKASPQTMVQSTLTDVSIATSGMADSLYNEFTSSEA